MGQTHGSNNQMEVLSDRRKACNACGADMVQSQKKLFKPIRGGKSQNQRVRNSNLIQNQKIHEKGEISRFAVPEIQLPQ